MRDILTQTVDPRATTLTICYKDLIDSVHSPEDKRGLQNTVQRNMNRTFDPGKRLVKVNSRLHNTGPFPSPNPAIGEERSTLPCPQTVFFGVRVCAFPPPPGLTGYFITSYCLSCCW